MPRTARARLPWLLLGVAGVVAPQQAQAQPASATPASPTPAVAEPPASAAPPGAASTVADPSVSAAPISPAPAAVAEAPASAAVAEPPASAAAVSAAPTVAEPPTAEVAADTPAPALAGIDILASLGWGASTMDVLRLKLSPYGGSAGLDLGYTWASGFRLGGYIGYSLGRSVSQTYDPLVGRTVDLVADTSSLNAGVSVAYDVPVYCFVLRYALGFGATSMNWDFSETPNIARYSESPLVGFHVVPGATLLWRSGLFEGGAGFRYLVQANGAIPSGFLGELLAGVRL